MNIKITVRNKLPICGDVAIVCNNSDYTVVWELGEEWAAYDTKTMRTAYQDGTYTDTVFTGNTVALPVVTVPGRVKIGLYAGDIHTSRPALIRALDSITSDGGTPAAPSEDVYNQIMELIKKRGHWETVLDTVWEQDVIHPTAYDAETGIFTCAAGELDNLELNTEYVFFPQCTKEYIAYNTIFNWDVETVTKLSDTTFSINGTPPATFVVENVKFSRGECLAIKNIDARKIRLTLDGQFHATATNYEIPFFGAGKPYFAVNTGYQQIRNAFQAYQQVTAEVESPFRLVGEILCGFNAPSASTAFHFKNNSFSCPLIPHDAVGGNSSYAFNLDGTKFMNLYSTSCPWFYGRPQAVRNDQLKIISGTKVKLERWVE